MASLGMFGPYDFTSEKVDEIITKKSPGNYALGYISQKTGKFIVRYVGRSDSDVNDRIKDHIDESDEYQSFKFSYATSPKDAYAKECENWHDFGGLNGELDNSYHPDKPNDTNWKCPKCGK